VLSKFGTLTARTVAENPRIARCLVDLFWSVVAAWWFHLIVVPEDPLLWKARSFVSSMLLGPCAHELVNTVRGVAIEVAKTKPWPLLTSALPRLDHGSLEFRTLQVGPNLATALRYLREDDKPVTLWIDALCINQADETEKGEQILRMAAVYANATPVLIWLGGYHGIRGRGCAAGEEGVNCEHRRQIQAAFYLVRCMGHRFQDWVLFWRTVDGEARRFHDGRAGLLEIYSRGWWQRLWVIQEVLLATAPVQMQCGTEVCTYHSFINAHHRMDRRNYYHEESGLVQAAGVATYFCAVFHEFSFSRSKDQPEVERISTAVFKAALGSACERVGLDSGMLYHPFHDRAFGARLQRVLLRTAGRFKCRDDCDRLFGVLGIVAGARGGSNSKARDVVTRLINFVPAALLPVAHSLQPLYESAGTATRLAMLSPALALSLWDFNYFFHAEHWSFHRPEYVVAESEDDQVQDLISRLRNAERIEFFTLLASYLATWTNTLAFLDAAHCGEDEDSDLPSWAPNWARQVGDTAYHFSTSRSREGQAKDRFRFIQDGKVLETWGRPRGTVHVVRPVATSPSRSQRRYEGFLSHSSAVKRDSLTQELLVYAAIVGMAASDPFPHPRRWLDWLLRRAWNARLEKHLPPLIMQWIMALFEECGKAAEQDSTTRVYSFDKRAREMGYLKAGEAARGDRIVFVPGCFHHLLLRRQPLGRHASVRWKLVGLVAFGTEEARERGCSEEEWARLRREGGLFKYRIT
jgi:hypothetical protein